MSLLRLPCLLLLPALAGTAVAQQQINRCTDASGRTVYSDRRCEDLGAQARLPVAARPAGQAGLYRDSCARKLSDLVAQIHTAADARDVNQLATVYWWSGVSRNGANAVIERLEQIVQRPLVDIAPVFAHVPDATPAPPQPFTYLDGTPVDPDAELPPPAPVTPPARPRPIGLRLEQTLANTATPVRTVLWLRRQYNCFWVSL